MKINFKLSTLFKSLTLILYTNLACAQFDSIILFADMKRVGELKQVQAIGNELVNALKTRASCNISSDNIVSETCDAFHGQDLLKSIHNKLINTDNRYVIVIAAGESTIDTLVQITPNPKLYIVYSHHQVLPDHYNRLINIVNMYALPRHAITQRDANDLAANANSQNFDIVLTHGVPHTLKLSDYSAGSDLDEQFSKMISTSAKSKYVGLILGGDAPNPDKKIQFYTLQEAKKLAQYIAPIVKQEDAQLLILNGPRTGQHNPITSQVNPDAHRVKNQLDSVSQAFVDTLIKNGLHKDKDFILFDFQYNDDNFYEPVLHTLLQNQGQLYVPGESTSMISEALDNLPNGNVTVYTNNAMNETHHRHCMDEYACGRVDLLESTNDGWKLIWTKSGDEDDNNERASVVIARRISRELARNS